MKNYLFSLCVVTMVLTLPVKVNARHGGGDVAVGALGGLAVGTMIGSATARDKSGGRAEQEAVRAQDKAEQAKDRAEQIRQEQQEKMMQLQREMDRKEMERRDQERKDSTFNMLMALIALLGLAVIALGFMVLRKK